MWRYLDQKYHDGTNYIGTQQVDTAVSPLQQWENSEGTIRASVDESYNLNLLAHAADSGGDADEDSPYMRWRAAYRYTDIQYAHHWKAFANVVSMGAPGETKWSLRCDQGVGTYPTPASYTEVIGFSDAGNVTGAQLTWTQRNNFSDVGALFSDGVLDIQADDGIFLTSDYSYGGVGTRLVGGEDLPYPEVPTIRSGLSKVMQDLQEVPFKQIFLDLQKTIQDIDKRVESEDVTG